MKTKYDINIRFNRRFGVARITFLRGCKRIGEYTYCSSEDVEGLKVKEINEWLRRNKAPQRKHPMIFKRNARGKLILNTKRTKPLLFA